MATSVVFGNVLGFKTNTRDVVAIAESDSYAVVGQTGVTAVDVILVGYSNGRRTGVVLNAGATGVTAAVGEVWVANS